MMRPLEESGLLAPAFDMRALVALCACVLVGCAGSSTRDYDGVLSITNQNDEQTGSDNNYTNGAVISWASNEVSEYEEGSFVRNWARFWSFLPHVGDADTYAAWQLGQEVYTADDISDPDPPLDDQPYAGITYLDSLLRAQRARSAHTWILRLGFVGPSSHADDVQQGAHDLIGATKPQGWATQLPDEPFVNVGYAADYLWLEGEVGQSASWRLVPTGNAELGTYLVAAGGGLYGEIGWNLPAAFGGRRLLQGFEPGLTVGVGPQPQLSLAFYGGLGGYGIAHFLPLDGTVFKDSRSVDSNPWLGIASAGVSLRYKRFAVRTGLSYYSETFATEREQVSFATWEFAWYF